MTDIVQKAIYPCLTHKNSIKMTCRKGNREEKIKAKETTSMPPINKKSYEEKYTTKKFLTYLNHKQGKPTSNNKSTGEQSIDELVIIQIKIKKSLIRILLHPVAVFKTGTGGNQT